MNRKGFTLIELLLVIGIIAILASIVIVAINPTKQLADARDAQRRSDVNTILNAVYQYAIDNNGNLPTCIATTRKGICTVGSACASFDSGTHANVVVTDSDSCNLDTLTGSYLVSLPLDPSGVPTGATAYTGYDIQEVTGGRVTVFAPIAENTTISVTR
ncbi:prepilin-type N-terminal cleavage/methylation domain-containing protein [Candidatus Peribacteria bacterium]|nr:prepilin-type N-terminal cleavage/methylation domain-containing protein [Candidatus Peribacteria bacterium]